MLKTIVEYQPYTATFPLDPSRVDTVGDQVLVEHIFGFHISRSEQKGTLPHLSQLDINWKDNLVRLTPRFKIKDAEGTRISMEHLCNRTESAVRSSLHSPFDEIVEKVDCNAKDILIKFKKIPINIEDLLTAPDFAIYRDSDVPMTGNQYLKSTGPYMVSDVSDRKSLKLKLNENYPSDLRANTIPNLEIRRYDSKDIDSILEHLSPDRDHFLYMIAESITPERLSSIRDRGFQVDIFPSEWLLFVGFSDKTPFSKRAYIGNVIDQIRPKISDSLKAIHAQPSFSFAPLDRPFGLKKEEYLAEKPRNQFESDNISLAVLPGTLDQPFYQALLQTLKQQIPQIEIVQFESFNWEEFSTKCDAFLIPTGASPADPLTHLSYNLEMYPGFDRVLSKAKIAEMAVAKSQKDLAHQIRDVEKKFLKDRIFIPIAHMPGIVVRSPLFERDENLAWNWGIQPWTYRLR